MDKIRNISQILEIVRAQISAQPQSARKTRTQSKSPSQSGTVGKLSQQALKQSIRDKLKNLDPDSNENMARSKQLFLESILVWEFGEELINDPLFPELIEKIQSTLDNSPETSSEFEKMLRGLIK